MADLGGRVIACLEARHAKEMADLVARHRGISYPAPCLHEVHEPNAEQIQRAVELLIGDGVDAAVFLTGVGVLTIAEAAERMGEMDRLRESLANKRVAARGPKTLNALRRVGIRVDVTAPEPFTSDALLEEIQQLWQLDGQSVLLQLYGAPVPRFTAGIEAMGATTFEVSPYRWERPADQEAVVRLIEDVVEGWVDVLAATSAAQVENLFAIARDNGYEDRLRGALATSKPLVAAQGIVCARAFQREGIAIDVIPPRASMGALLIEIARFLNSVKTETPEAPVALAAGTIAVLPTNDVVGADLTAAMAAIPVRSIVTLLAGKERKSHRVVEEAAVNAGFSVHALMPDNTSGHPSDELVRKADAVIVVTKSGLGAGRLLQLAHRYAKPVRLIRLEPEEPSAPLP